MNQFKKGIEDIRALRLSDEEKRNIHAHIMSLPLPSPYTHTLLIVFSRSWASYSIASILIIVLVGGSAAVAAEQSVPGDILYPIKIKITEPARDLLIQEPANYARWESEKASRRLEEATTLAERNELTPERSRDIEERFQEHAREAAEAFTALALANGTSTAYDVEKEFDGSLAEHERSLHTVSKRNEEKTEKDTSSLEKKIKEVRSKFREDESRSRSERDRKEGERDTDVSDHNGSPRQERDSVKKVEEEDEGNESGPDTRKQEETENNLKNAVKKN